jgi:isoleucyl-tRNA synthetase
VVRAIYGRARRHRRPPPDAPSRRLLRQARARSSPGEFVTTDQGTGLVHMAPGHGEDDFLLCKAHGIDTVFAVEDDGRYRADWAWLGGQGSVINPSSTRRTGRSARTSAKPAPSSPHPRTSSTATRTAGAPKPRSSSAPPRNGSSRWTGQATPARKASRPSLPPPLRGRAGWGCGCGAAARSCGAHPLPNPSPQGGGA